MKKGIFILIALLHAGCAHHTQNPKYALITDYEDPVRVITDKEIEQLPDILTMKYMSEHFGRSMRCEVAIGIYPRYSKNIDYTKPLGEHATDYAYMFLPRIHSDEFIDAVACSDGKSVTIIWPKKIAGMSLQDYWNSK